MSLKNLLIVISICLFILNTPLSAEENPSIVSVIIKGALKGMAEEAGKRFMETMLNNNSKSITWYEGMRHPVYDNVIASKEKGRWLPEKGYVWLDQNNKNDWTVILKKNKIIENINLSSVKYTLVYKGNDGMNIRATPGGRNILATTFFQNYIPLLHTPSLSNTSGDWKKFKITGWMVEKNHHNNHKYLSKTNDGISTIIWDGNGNLKDNFINLRTNTHLTSNIVAKVYTNTSIRVIDRKVTNKYDWVKAELIGWIKVQKSTGKKYLTQTAS